MCFVSYICERSVNFPCLYLKVGLILRSTGTTYSVVIMNFIINGSNGLILLVGPVNNFYRERTDFF